MFAALIEQMGPVERQLFAWMIEQVEHLEHLLILIAQRHRALLEVLARKEVITPSEIKAALAERQAALAVDDTFDTETQERKKAREDMKDLLRGDLEE